MIKALGFLTVAGAALAPAAASAADGLLTTILGAAVAVENPGSEDMPAARLYDQTTLNPAMLKRCLILAHTLDDSAAAIDKQREALRAGKAEIERLQKLAEAAPKSAKPGAVHGTPKEAVTWRLRDFLTASAHFEADINKRNQGVATFNKDCAGRKYFAADLVTVRRELPFSLKPYEPAR